MKTWMKLVLSIFIVILIVFGVTFSYAFYRFSKINTTKISKTDENLGIKPEVALKTADNLSIKPKVTIKKEAAPEIINIAFFGVDRRSMNEPSRSDSIIILSIDEVHKKIKMSSVMRDTYVEIKDHGETKINHAYAYGGPQLAIRTLNENFNLNIREYVTVDFFSFEKIIDAIDGVIIDVKQDEINLIPQITKTGPQTLNGLQAVAYSRIRHTVGDDYRRTERQRTVLSVMLKKIQSLGVTEFPAVVSKLLPYTETSMNSMEIIKIGTKVVTSNIVTLEQERFPLDGYCTGKMMNGVWYLVADMEATVKQLHKFIYEDIKPVQ